MNFKKFLPIIFVTFSTFTYGQQTVDKFKLYGFIRNDFYYNSRQNVESIDGVYHLFPKPIEIASGVDKNGAPQAEMLSIATRLGLDINGSDIFGAKSSGKIEADFAGFSSNYYVLRVRHAYIKLNWAKTELLLGQTWHPLFGSVMPTIPSLNAGAPFQPFNRSPQFRLKYNISSSLSVTASANYQMQYTSSGPLGPSSVYMKNAMLPDLFLGTECKTEHWISGTGIDVKTIQPVSEKLTSMVAIIYSQYVTTKFQLKGKIILGQNMSDYVMPYGYGVSDTTSTGGPKSFSNINMISGWINAVYGSKVQTGINRVEELKLFAINTGVKRIGIAHCVGMTREALDLRNRLSDKFEVYTVDCKYAKIKGSEMLNDETVSGTSCNPAGQADFLARNETDLNISFGLCVGHDILFNIKSKAPTTTLVVKDREHKHNTYKEFAINS